MLTCKITNVIRTTKNMLYKNHCHVTTIQLLALGHVDNKMRTQFWEFFLQMCMYIQMIIKTVYKALILTV
jgi:hypothetical protein